MSPRLREYLLFVLPIRILRPEPRNHSVHPVVRLAFDITATDDHLTNETDPVAGLNHHFRSAARIGRNKNTAKPNKLSPTSLVLPRSPASLRYCPVRSRHLNPPWNPCLGTTALLARRVSGEAGCVLHLVADGAAVVYASARCILFAGFEGRGSAYP